ncbi:MAG: zeta toxin family protein [Elusimicrobia bacterium]|nr:zeta toxin family protein [Elusimicrobiota bacterium]MDE2427059.1 zeta toxin family protein [Elusimicrobiota bacterium]
MPTSIPLYVIAGPNGAGKTTFAAEFLPHFAKCREFVNADYIATGIAPFAPSTAAIEAGRVMLSRIKELVAQRHSFAFETTLSGRGYLSLFQEIRKAGYRINLFYLWLPSVELAIQRVHDRVRSGGHSVPDGDVRRRFDRGLKNLFGEYLPLLDGWTLINNSERHPRIIAYGLAGAATIKDAPLFEKIKANVERA